MRQSLLIPSDERFISNKRVSDRIYSWILINGTNIQNNIYIDKKVRNAYKELGLAYRTFYRKIDELIEEGYLEEEEFQYKVKKDVYDYKRYIYKDIIQKLLDTKMNNIIKVYVYLSSLYDTNKKTGTETYFRYNSLSSMLGYYGGENRDSRNEKTIRLIIEKLAELGFITYVPKYIKVGENYQTNFILLNVKTK